VLLEPSYVVWGCEAYVKCLMLDKLTPKSYKCLFEGKVLVAHNGVFLEKEFLSKGVSGSKVQLEEKKKMFHRPLIPYMRYKLLYR
jgi:hypothetical protein